MRAKRRSCAVSSSKVYVGPSTREYRPPISPAKACSPLGPRVTRQAGRTTWNHQCITGGRHGRGITANELYIGEIHWNVRSTILNPETQKKQKRRNPEERHIVVKNAELRIIRNALDSAQKVAVNALSYVRATGKPRRGQWSAQQ